MGTGPRNQHTGYLTDHHERSAARRGRRNGNKWRHPAHPPAGWPASRDPRQTPLRRAMYGPTPPSVNGPEHSRPPKRTASSVMPPHGVLSPSRPPLRPSTLAPTGRADGSRHRTAASHHPRILLTIAAPTSNTILRWPGRPWLAQRPAQRQAARSRGAYKRPASPRITSERKSTSTAAEYATAAAWPRSSVDDATTGRARTASRAVRPAAPQRGRAAPSTGSLTSRPPATAATR